MVAFAVIVSLAFVSFAAGRNSFVNKLKALQDDSPIRDIISDILTRLDEKDEQVLDLQTKNREKKILLNQLNRTLESQIKLKDNLKEKLERMCAMNEGGCSDNVTKGIRQELTGDHSVRCLRFNERRQLSENTDVDTQPQESGDMFTSSTIPVAFFATISDKILHSGVNQIIEFDNIVTNIGKHFIPHVGAFICPRDGVYMFTTTLVVEPGQDTHFKLRKNDSPLSWIFVNGKPGSQTVVVVMNKGDTITLINTGIDQSLIGGNYSTFGGYLLYETIPPSTITIVN